MNPTKCGICGKPFDESELITGLGIRHELETLIQADHPEWNDYSKICK